jgi:hypothetical protein
MTMAKAAEIVQGNNEFALDLYSHLAQAGASNLFFSPYSISSALAMTFAGARGRTEQEMASVLRFDAGQERHLRRIDLARSSIVLTTEGHVAESGWLAGWEMYNERTFPYADGFTVSCRDTKGRLGQHEREPSCHLLKRHCGFSAVL